LVATFGFCAALTWAAIPREPAFDLGPAADFPLGQPARRAVTNGVEVYLVSMNGTPTAWDARAPLAGTRCLYRWVPTNTRFEDPCSGNKWCLDGTIADDRAGAERTLDAYVLTVDDHGHVWLRPGRLATGTPMPDPPQSTARNPYRCEHLQSPRGHPRLPAEGATPIEQRSSIAPTPAANLTGVLHSTS
jgi:hypothetical protein